MLTNTLRRNELSPSKGATVDFSIKENAMPRYQFLNIETFHLIIADAKEAAWRLGLMRGPLSMQPEMSILDRPPRSSSKTESTRSCRF